jgi:hypothetical protein
MRAIGVAIPMKTRYRATRRLAVLLGLLALALSSVSQVAGNTGVPRQKRFEVSDYSDSRGRRWIRLRSEFECSYREKMDDIVATLWDFPRSPKVFSRIEAVRLRFDTGTKAVTEQRTAVRVLGFAFISNLVFENTLTRPSPGAATVAFEMIETDGSCLSSKGGWTLEDRSGPGGPATYATFRIESLVEPRFPGQAAIMRAFGAADAKKAMRELGQATARS